MNDVVCPTCNRATTVSEHQFMSEDGTKEIYYYCIPCNYYGGAIAKRVLVPTAWKDMGVEYLR